MIRNDYISAMNGLSASEGGVHLRAGGAAGHHRQGALPGLSLIHISSDAERCEFELRLAGARNVTAAKALLSEHDGDVAKLKAAEPWLFSGPAPQGGSTGLEPAGAAKAADKDMKRWREIAGLEDEE